MPINCMTIIPILIGTKREDNRRKCNVILVMHAVHARAKDAN